MKLTTAARTFHHTSADILIRYYILLSWYTSIRRVILFLLPKKRKIIIIHVLYRLGVPDNLLYLLLGIYIYYSPAAATPADPYKKIRENDVTRDH